MRPVAGNIYFYGYSKKDIQFIWQENTHYVRILVKTLLPYKIVQKFGWPNKHNIFFQIPRVFRKYCLVAKQPLARIGNICGQVVNQRFSPLGSVTVLNDLLTKWILSPQWRQWTCAGVKWTQNEHRLRQLEVVVTLSRQMSPCSVYVRTYVRMYASLKESYETEPGNTFGWKGLESARVKAEGIRF